MKCTLAEQEWSCLGRRVRRGRRNKREGVWCLLVSAKPGREANTSRVKPDRLAPSRDRRRRDAAPRGENHSQTYGGPGEPPEPERSRTQDKSLKSARNPKMSRHVLLTRQRTGTP